MFTILSHVLSHLCFKLNHIAFIQRQDATDDLHPRHLTVQLETPLSGTRYKTFGLCKFAILILFAVRRAYVRRL